MPEPLNWLYFVLFSNGASEAVAPGTACVSPTCQSDWFSALPPIDEA